MQTKAVIVLLLLSAVSFTFGDVCVPITGTSNICSLPASTCVTSGTSVDGTTYNVGGYTTQVTNWNGMKSAICPNKPFLVDDYPLGLYCPDSCTSNYTCDANAKANPWPNPTPMCYHLCVECFSVASCTSWSQNPGNVTRPGGPETSCYASWTHKGVDALQINNVAPTWGYLKGNQKIVITGCGFSTYSEATCVWGEWHSKNAIIVDDGTIHCWTPAVSFITIPTTTSFEIIFDGTPAISRRLPDFWWGPMITGVTPTQVYVNGGSPLSISGFGFSEYNGSVVVMIDNATCGGPSVTDNLITCSIPIGTINQNAIIDVYFSGWKYYFLHSNPWTLHYGPILTSVNPTCGSMRGGTVITLSGSLFDDPILANPRVEFFINSAWWWGTAASHSGSNVLVTTPPPPVGTPDLFGQDIQVVVFGGAYPIFSRVPGSTFYHYGALMFSVSPTIGYIDGGETVSITGCAFTDYNATDLNILAAAVALCQPSTTTIVNSNLVTCTSAASTACYQSVPITMGLPLSRTLPVAPLVLNWWWGPFILGNTLTPSRGAWSVNSSAAVTGIKLGRSASTLFGSAQCRFSSVPGDPFRNSLAYSQTSISCFAPSHLFNTDSVVNYQFEAPCGQSPHTSSYHYGPTCTGVTPTFGYLGGGASVTLNGVGFSDADWTISGASIRARFCVPGIGAGCNWEQDIPLTIASTNAATGTTPGFALAPRNGLGANRYFGNNAAITVFYIYPTGGNETRSLTCGSYRYGPIVTSTSPRKGPIGPRAANSPGTPVTVNGVGFNDPLLRSNIRVAFGPIHGFGATTTSDTAISVSTLWGARANTDKHVYVYFDTCNTTASAQTWTWGPQVYNASPIFGYNGYNNKVVTIRGTGFEEWLYGSYTDAICVIDNLYGTNTAIVVDPQGGYMITCEVPTRPFGTQAAVQVVFGRNCRGHWDWTQVLTAPNDIYYRPNITGINPTVGYTSGGQTVTVMGKGLGGWNANLCYFGHYLGTVTTAPSALDDPVVCTTPARRADFNSDVLVHVQMEPGTGIASAGYQAKVWGPTYHYGPLCTGVSPSWGYLAPDPNMVISLSGVGFLDNTFFNSTPTVLIGTLNVTVTNPGASDTVITFTGMTNTTQCLTTKSISIYWGLTSRVISCPVFTHGPRVFSSTPDLGWSGDTVTVNGDFMDDPLLQSQLTHVQVVFGSAAGTTLSVGKLTVTATAPVNNWLADPLVVVRWAGGNFSCINDAVLKANNFHYGPIITSIEPTFGYVYGRRPVTVTGRGFTCCGLQPASTVCRFARNDITPQDGATTVVGDTTITCFSIIRTSPEITGSSNALTTKAVGMRFNDTAQNRIIDTDTPNLPRQPLVTYFYGPLVTAVAPTFGRIRGSTTIVISGAGFLDPFFMNVPLANPNPACRYTPMSGSTTQILINSTVWTDTSITCLTPDWVRRCGDPLDVIALSFWVNTSASDRFIIPTDAKLTHYYGPIISSISPVRGFVKGGDSVTINISEMDEWTGRKAKILFANREINDVDNPIAGNSFTVNSPRGSFLHSGPISVILDYKNDGPTTLPFHWHWIPYSTSLSINWAMEGGGSSVSVYGAGFCEYELVTCSFGASQGVQSDVAYDDRVVCASPESGPGSAAVSLTFCDFNNDCHCQYVGSADVVPAPQFTFVGLTGIAPVSGPWVGGTTVTFSGAGFDIFSGIRVMFGGLSPVNPVGNGTSSNSFTVVTPASPNAQSVQVFVEFTYTFSDGQTMTFTVPDRSSAPVNFHYGYPDITSQSVTTSDVDAVNIDVTLTGMYFNGGVLSAIRCFWTVPTATGGTTLNLAAKSKTDTTVVCTAPGFAGGVTRHGPATVQVSYDGTRRSNLAPWLYTQNPTITSLFPTQGPEFGANAVTITGNDFNAGISVLCRFNTVITGATNVIINGGTSTTGASTTGSASTSTTGASNTTTANSTTAGTSTTGTTTSGSNSTIHIPHRRSQQGVGDQIICLAPRSLATTFPAAAPVQISLDGGLTWTTATTGNTYTYLEGFTSTSENPSGGTTTDAAHAVVPLVSLIFALIFFVALF